MFTMDVKSLEDGTLILEGYASTFHNRRQSVLLTGDAVFCPSARPPENPVHPLFFLFLPLLSG